MKYSVGRWAGGVLLCPQCADSGPHYPRNFGDFEGVRMRKMKCFNNECEKEFLAPPHPRQQGGPIPSLSPAAVAGQ